jgi:putative glutamine amidotransferase
MLLRLICFLILSTLLPCASWAVQLFVWQSSPQAPQIILPRGDSESAEKALARYQRNLQKPSLSSLVPAGSHLPMGQVFDLSTETKSGKVRMAMIANWYQDMTAEGLRINNNFKLFKRSGAEPYVIALAADVGLSEKEASEYREKIANHFSLLVSLGGDDISPELYGEKPTYARNTNIVRDRSELALVKTYKKLGKGIFFGICRGHQMGAVADGHKLYQDLSKTGVGNTENHVNENGTNLQEKQTWHHLFVQDSLLKRFLRGSDKILVNSLHHQAVHVQEKAESFAIAFDDKDNIVEALQSKNLKSLSVQFHPEFPSDVSGNVEFSNRGNDFFLGLVAYARMNRIKTNSISKCHKIYSRGAI